MISSLFKKAFGLEDGQDDDHQDENIFTGQQIAFASVLIEAALADQDFTSKEETLILSIIKRQFDLNDDRANGLLQAAKDKQAAANDLYQFSNILRDTLDFEEKKQLCEDLWAIVLSDETRVPYEDMLMRRIGGLVHVEDTELHAARKRVEHRLASNI